MPNKYGHIEEIAQYNRDNGTNFYRWDQVQQHRKENNPIRKFLNTPIKVPVTSGNATTFATSGNDIPKVDSTIGNELGYTAGLITTPMLFGEFAAGAIPGIVKIGSGMAGAAAGSYVGGKAGDFADEKLGTTALGDIGRFVGGLGGWGAGSKITSSQLNPIKRMTRVLNRNIDNIKSLELGNVPRNILFRSTVYKGGDIKDPHSIFFTTDKAYARQFGPVKKYLFESYNPVTAKEPLIGSRDSATMDMFIDRNVGSNQEARAILGHDLVTSDVNPSKGLEIYSFGNSNLVKNIKSQNEIPFNNLKMSGVEIDPSANVHQLTKDFLADSKKIAWAAYHPGESSADAKEGIEFMRRAFKSNWMKERLQNEGYSDEEIAKYITDRIKGLDDLSKTGFAENLNAVRDIKALDNGFIRIYPEALPELAMNANGLKTPANYRIIELTRKGSAKDFVAHEVGGHSTEDFDFMRTKDHKPIYDKTTLTPKGQLMEEEIGKGKPYYLRPNEQRPRFLITAQTMADEGYNPNSFKDYLEFSRTHQSYGENTNVGQTIKYYDSRTIWPAFSRAKNFLLPTAGIKLVTKQK